PGFALIFILVSGTLYLYASSLKHVLIINNLLISLLIAFSIILFGIFNLYPVITADNQELLSMLFQGLLEYAILAFLFRFIREIVKNLKDIDYNYNEGISTIPIILGKERTAKLLFFITLIPVALLLYYGNTYIIFFNLIWALIYGLVFILGPMIYFL